MTISESRAVVVSNRFNILELLSGGLFPARNGFNKYYRDLLELTPDRVPLVSTPVPKTFLDRAKETAAAFPVLVEVDASALPEGSDAIELEGGLRLWAVRHAIPFYWVRALHFSSQDDLDEHRSREYENVLDLLSTEVSPDLFAVHDSEDFPGALAWLDDFSEGEGGEAPLGLVDRIAGARLACTSPARPIPDETWAAVWQPVPLSEVLDASAAALLQSDAAGDHHDLDRRLHGVICAALLETDVSKGWVPLELVDRIEKDMTEGEAHLGDELWQRLLARIRAILRNEVTLEPMRPGGLTSARALLLVLLRREPARLLAWPHAETGASNADVTLALFYSGLLVGRRLLGAELKANAETFRWSVALSCAELGIAEVPEGPPPTQPVPPERLEPAPVGEPVQNQPAIVEALRKGRRRRAVKSALLRAAIDLGWNDCLTTRLSLPPGGFRLEATGDETTLTVPGVIQVETEVDVGRVLERLDEEAINAEVLVRLADVVGV